ncbi:hypothetical protein B0H14DRAFT_2614885 [Mycena olivaceomarginata]|nr:hypothetical protein B0H14DRAFT_2614885 [Mycena olivaceomarginata]
MTSCSHVSSRQLLANFWLSIFSALSPRAARTPHEARLAYRKTIRDSGGWNLRPSHHFDVAHPSDPTEKALADASQFLSENLETVILEHVPNGNPGVLVLFQDRVEAIKNAWIVVEVVPTPVSEMFERVKNKARLVNMHYYMPPECFALLLREAPRHGLRAYHVSVILSCLLTFTELTHDRRKESVGLLFNRIWAAIKRESVYVVAQGVAGAAEVGGIMKDVLGMNRGVFEMLDSVGLDVALDIETHQAHIRPGQIPPEPATLLKSMVGAGTLGVKSGKGFL